MKDSKESTESKSTISHAAQYRLVTDIKPFNDDYHRLNNCVVRDLPEFRVILH